MVVRVEQVLHGLKLFVSLGRACLRIGRLQADPFVGTHLNAECWQTRNARQELFQCFLERGVVIAKGRLAGLRARLGRGHVFGWRRRGGFDQGLERSDGHLAHDLGGFGQRLANLTQECGGQTDGSKVGRIDGSVPQTIV